MDWIKENVHYLKNHRLTAGEIEAEHQRAREYIRNFHPIGSQFVYAVSYLSDEIIYLTDGVKKMLGFEPGEINNLDFFYERVHPDDLESVKKLTIQAIKAGADKYGIKPMEHVFNVIYRIGNSNGRYIKIHRQTGKLTHDENGVMLTSFGIITDVSRLSDTQKVQGYMTGPEIPDYRFVDHKNSPKANFTDREMEIIDLMAKGMSSEKIGEKLYISKDTVNTHRRNILGKSGVNNSAALMAYVFKNGY